MKRVFDVTVAAIALAILFPFGLIVCAILRFTGEGLVWYRQPRVGKNGDQFQLYKFVTMRVGSENEGSKDITVRNDPRVLPFGRFLRKTKINELPQLINVLMGDMSIVGWRPLVPRGFGCYPIEAQKVMIAIRPGLTGVGSIVFRDEETIMAGTQKDLIECYNEDIQPYKGELETWYIRHQSFWLDMKIIFCTVGVILFPSSKFYLRLFPGLPTPDPDSEISRIRGLETSAA